MLGARWLCISPPDRQLKWSFLFHSETGIRKRWEFTVCSSVISGLGIPHSFCPCQVSITFSAWFAWIYMCFLCFVEMQLNKIQTAQRRDVPRTAPSNYRYIMACKPSARRRTPWETTKSMAFMSASSSPFVASVSSRRSNVYTGQ